MATMTPIHVIGITGRARAGKDSVAKILEHYVSYHRIALADGIRSAFNDLSGPSWEFHKELSDQTINARKAMQFLGTECRIASRADKLWTDLALVKMAYASLYHPKPRTKFVVSDIRYPYETDRLRNVIEYDWQGRLEIWKIERPDQPDIPESAHSSEQSIASIVANRIIVNDGSKLDLAYKVMAAMRESG